jgi:hypothetical protein
VRLSGMNRFLTAFALLAGSLLGCGDDDSPYYDQCRFDPEGCRGGLGGACRSSLECGIGFCCREPKECGGGMCTFECRNDLDCPVDMACEHDVCFYKCRSDYDCALDQHCGHGRTVCEW